MANLVRKTASGKDAESLVSRGAAILRSVERMPGFFGNPLLDEAYKNAMGKRWLIGEDGSVLRTQRGPISRVQATTGVPGQPQQEQPIFKEYFALDVFNDAAEFIGIVVFPLADVTKPAAFVPLDSIHDATSYRDEYAGSIVDGNFTEETVRVADVGMARELIGNFVGTDIVTRDISTTIDYDGSSGGGGTGVYQKNTLVRKRTLSPGAVEIYPWQEETTVTILNEGGYIDISAATPTTVKSFPGLDVYVDEMGFATKDVMTVSPFTTAPRFVMYYGGSVNRSGELSSSTIDGAYISEAEHAFSFDYGEINQNKTVLFNASTRTTTYFLASGVNETISTVGSLYYSDSGVLIPWASGYDRVNYQAALPVLSDTVSSVTTAGIKVDGGSYELATFDSAVNYYDFPTINHYRYPTEAAKMSIFVFEERAIDGPAAGDYILLGVVKNGTAKAKRIDLTSVGAMVIDGVEMFTYGEARVLVVRG